MLGSIRTARSGKRAALVISVLYALLASLWIVLSDRLIGQLVRDPDQLTEFQTYKGWLFVAVTAMLLYALLRFRTAFAQDAAESPAHWRHRPSFLVLAITAPAKITWFQRVSQENRFVIGPPAAGFITGRRWAR